MKTQRRYYNSCEFLPLWNFFKLNNGETQNLKYLIAIQDRLAYSDLVVEVKEVEVLEGIWSKVLEEYNSLENNFSAVNFLSDRSKILYFYTLYLQEQAAFKSLLYITNVGHIRMLRDRGYNVGGKTQDEYWVSLRDGLNKVQGHLAYIEILKNKIKSVEGDSKKEGNPYDDLMAWMLSNGMDVKEDITVSRYIKIKEIILQRQKAKQKENAKSRLHG